MDPKAKNYEDLDDLHDYSGTPTELDAKLGDYDEAEKKDEGGVVASSSHSEAPSHPKERSGEHGDEKEPLRKAATKAGPRKAASDGAAKKAATKKAPSKKAAKTAAKKAPSKQAVKKGAAKKAGIKKATAKKTTSKDASKKGGRR